MKPSRFLLLTNLCTTVALIYFVWSDRLPLRQLWIVASLSFVGLNLAAFLGLQLRKKPAK
jgi:hypothetical protein